jgi:hypothetical protein
MAIEIRYIKLGPESKWANECLLLNYIKFGSPMELDQASKEGDWDFVKNYWLNKNFKPSVASKHVTNARNFFELSTKDIFATFHGDFLYWCHPGDDIYRDKDGLLIRKTRTPWRNSSIKGQELRTSLLSGILTKTKATQSTTCNFAPDAAEYLLRKINDEKLPASEKADQLKSDYQKSIANLIQMLTPSDFELLVELIFSSSGLRRIGTLGGNEKDIDLQVQNPITLERSFVQVKSKADQKTLNRYEDIFNRGDFDKMFFAYHTSTSKLVTDNPSVKLLDRDHISRMAIDVGLGSWIISKTS